MQQSMWQSDLVLVTQCLGAGLIGSKSTASDTISHQPAQRTRRVCPWYLEAMQAMETGTIKLSAECLDAQQDCMPGWAPTC